MEIVNQVDGISLTPDIETASDRYASRFSGEVGEFFLEVQERLVLESLTKACGKLQGLTVLDVGGGHNQLTAALVHQGCMVVTHGTAAVCAERHHQNVAIKHTPFVVSELGRLPFADGTFDAVLSLRLIAHVSNWQDLLGEFRRVTKQAVLIDFAPRESFNFFTPLLYNWKKRIEQTTRPFVCHWSSEIKRAFYELRASDVSFQREFFVPMGIHRACRSRSISQLLEKIARGVSLTRFLGSPAVCVAKFSAVNTATRNSLTK